MNFDVVDRSRYVQRMTECPVCDAALRVERRDSHIEWHERQNTRIARLEKERELEQRGAR